MSNSEIRRSSVKFSKSAASIPNNNKQSETQIKQNLFPSKELAEIQKQREVLGNLDKSVFGVTGVLKAIETKVPSSGTVLNSNTQKCDQNVEAAIKKEDVEQNCSLLSKQWTKLLSGFLAIIFLITLIGILTTVFIKKF